MPSIYSCTRLSLNNIELTSEGATQEKSSRIRDFYAMDKSKRQHGNTKKIKQRIPENALRVLIDDTVTTGSTLIRASEIIREHFPNHSILIIALALEV